MNRETRITFRLSEEDRLLLERRAKEQHMSVSKYLRYLLSQDSGKLSYNPDDEKQLRRYFSDINRLGTNINQIARHLNSEIKTVSKVEKDLLVLLADVQEQVILVKAKLASLVRQIRL